MAKQILSRIEAIINLDQTLECDVQAIAIARYSTGNQTLPQPRPREWHFQVGSSGGRPKLGSVAAAGARTVVSLGSRILDSRSMCPHRKNRTPIMIAVAQMWGKGAPKLRGECIPEPDR